MILWVRYSCPYLHSMRERFGAAPTQFTDRDGETYAGFEVDYRLGMKMHAYLCNCGRAQDCFYYI